MKASSWVMVPLEAICAPCRYPIGDGDHGAIKPSMYTTSGIPYIRVADIGEGELLKDKLVYITADVHRNNPKSHLFPGDIVISKTGTIGNVAIIPSDMPKANTTSSVGKITLDAGKVIPRFVLYYMLSPRFQADIWAVSHKSAQPGFNIRDLKKFKVPLPPLKDQEHIVKLLDEADELRKLRALANRRTDELIPALFHEMFGDLRTNERGWHSGNLGDLCTDVVDCPHSTPIYAPCQTPYPCVRSSDIQKSRFDWSTTKYVIEEEYLRRIKNFVPIRNDIVFCREGARLGNAAQLTDDTTICLGQRMMLFRASPQASTSEFLWAVLQTELIQQQIASQVGGSASPHLNVRDIKKFTCVIPPLSLQEAFSGMVAEVRKMETAQASSRLCLEALFESVLHRAFNGGQFSGSVYD